MAGCAIARRFKSQGFDPEGYTLCTDAAFQVFAAAATTTLQLDALERAPRGSTP